MDHKTTQKPSSILSKKRFYFAVFGVVGALFFIATEMRIPNIHEGNHKAAASSEVEELRASIAALTKQLNSEAAVPPPPQAVPVTQAAVSTPLPAAAAPTVDLPPAVKAGKIEATGIDPGLYAPTGYLNTDAYPQAKLFPAKLELEAGKLMEWSTIKLPEKLPIHGLRIENRMPQLGVVLDVDAIKAPGAGTKFTFTEEPIDADDLVHTKYKQMYEPATPYSVETGVMAEVVGNCFMTMPEKGLRTYTVTYKDGSKKTVAILPMLGPFGNEKRFNCYPKPLTDALGFEGKADVDLVDEVGEPESSGFLMSFKPSGSGYIVWDEERINSYEIASRNRVLTNGNYIEGNARLYNVFKHYSPAGKRCLVVGSAPDPWVEGILLDHGAAHITTSEYQVPEIPKQSRYASRMTTIHHEDLLKNPVLFDMIVIFSSIEHDGLGRYHDPMSPGGDLQQMRNLYDLLKPGGNLILEVPIDNPDGINIPHHRRYGPVRHPLLIAPFKLLGMFNVNDVTKVGEEPGIGGCNKVDTITAAVKKIKADGSEDHVAVLEKPVL